MITIQAEYFRPSEVARDGATFFFARETYLFTELCAAIQSLH
jgi:hypothetical protein